MGITDKLWDGYNKVDRDFLDSSGVDMHNWGHVKSVHSHDHSHGDWGTVKALGKGALAVGSGTFQTVTNTGFSTMAYTAATGGAVALSSTGIGAVAVAGAYALGSSVAAGVSVYKTHKHIENLQAIHDRGCTRGFCEGDRNDHNTIYTHVLPYIINKKKRKMRRKGEETVPLLGSMATTLETGMRSIWKRARGTRGTERHYHTQVLTKHLVTCTCDMTEDIVAELWSLDEMRAIRCMDSDDAGYWIYSKMASI
jgi:hypothetical protein